MESNYTAEREECIKFRLNETEKLEKAICSIDFRYSPVYRPKFWRLSRRQSISVHSIEIQRTSSSKSGYNCSVQHANSQERRSAEVKAKSKIDQ